MSVTSSLVPIPQPKPHPLLKNVREVDAGCPILSFMRLARTLGPIYRLAFPGDPGLVLVSSRELVHELCDESRFDKKVVFPLEQLRAMAGDGLITAHTGEPNWGKAHRLLMPAFGPVAIHGMFDPMLDIADQLLLRWERFGPDAVIDVVDNMTRLTLDTIALCAFGYRFNSFYRDEMHPFVDAMLGGLRETVDRTRRFTLLTKVMLRTRRRFDENARYMHRVADELIAERKRDPNAGGKKDLLGLMLQGRDPQTGEVLSDENIRYQMVTFLMAGHETTSGLLSFALYLLLKHPHVLQKARAQVDEALRAETPRVEDLARLPYIEQVLKESLRLWPTVTVFGRQPYEDTVVGGKYRLERGTNALVLLPMLHRDPAVWGDDPERFDPDRFAPEAEAALPADAYKPFGTGQRACIGRPFAMQEAQLVLAMILQRFDLIEHDPAYQLRIKQTLTIKPDGFYIRARRRGTAAAPRPLTLPFPPTAGGESRVRGVVVAPRAMHGAAPVAPERPLTSLLVLYGSNSGSAEGFARRIASEARRQGFAADVDTMDARAGQLPASGAVVVVTASYNGQPPDNAKQFVAWAEGLSRGSLSGVRFGVFGCGHRDWVRTYQAVPKRVDAALEAAGAVRVVARGEADAGGDFFGDFERWYDPFWGTLAGAFGMAARAPAAGPGFDVEVVPESGRCCSSDAAPRTRTSCTAGRERRGSG
jgi:cytochrome P450/NADPH-cytochrome P450 reductase